MSGQWEVVGKKKDRGSKLPVPKNNINAGSGKPDKNAKNKNILNGVKLEEVLPKSQVQSLYSGNKKNKENKPQEKKPQDVSTKKQEKKVKPQEPPKPKPPKSIESALNILNADDLTSTYETSRTQYPDSPTLWLQKLIRHLNRAIPVEVQDPVFSNKPTEYPWNIVPSNAKPVIEKAVKNLDKEVIRSVFDSNLTSMAMDMSVGHPGTGYRFVLQHIALTEPELVVNSLSKHVVLRNSYQNRANIALSILWAVGQAGVNSFQSGLAVFQELMLPLIEMKNYSRYVTKYLLDLIGRDSNPGISLNEYLLILDTIYASKKNVPTEYQKELYGKAANLKNLLLKDNKENLSNYVEQLLKRIETNSNEAYRENLCDVLVTVFSRDHTTFNTWNKIYSKNLAASAVLLKYINDNVQAISKTFNKNNLKEFLEILESFDKVSRDLMTKKKKREGLKQALSNIKNIQEDFASNKKKRGGFFSSLLYYIFVLSILGVAGELIYKSYHGRSDETVYRHLTGQVGAGLNYIDGKFEAAYPQQRKKVVEVVEPYVDLSRDVGKILYNQYVRVRITVDAFVAEKYPVVRKQIEAYAPGLIDNSQKVLNNAFSTSALYFNRSVDYLQREVFVGQLSPQNVQKVVLEAFNKTSQKATECYHWLYEKVNSNIK